MSTKFVDLYEKFINALKEIATPIFQSSSTAFIFTVYQKFAKPTSTLKGTKMQRSISIQLVEIKCKFAHTQTYVLYVCVYIFVALHLYSYV